MGSRAGGWRVEGGRRADASEGMAEQPRTCSARTSPRPSTQLDVIEINQKRLASSIAHLQSGSDASLVSDMTVADELKATRAKLKDKVLKVQLLQRAAHAFGPTDADHKPA